MIIVYSMANGKTTTQNIPGTPAARRDQLTVALIMHTPRWISEEARTRGWRLVNLWHYSYNLPDTMTPHGALVSVLPDDKSVLELIEQGCSVVRLGNLPHPDDDSVPAVLPDHHATGALAADHFFKRGFQHVAYAGHDPWSDSKTLFDGFHDGAKALEMDCHLHRFKETAGSDAAKNGKKEQEFIAWIKNVPKPVGLLVHGAWYAAVYSIWVAKAGLSVPSEVAILSRSNNNDICETSMPTISYIVQDDEGLMRTACDLLTRMIGGEPAPKEPIMIPPKGVVELESTSILATSDQIVAKALRYMWDYLDTELTVDDVAYEVGLSSRQLERRFRHALGRSVNEELRRKRLEDAKQLLLSTDLPIADLGKAVGFQSPAYFHTIFRKAYGMTPAQYRRGSDTEPLK